MIAVIQTVEEASVSVEGRTVGSIDRGMLVYFGVEKDDDESLLGPFIGKMMKLRIFKDENEKMNLTLAQSGGQILFISQFTLSADVYHGNRPSFDSAEEPGKAKAMYEAAVSYLREKGLRTETGVFGAHMEISYINDGPVTFVLDSDGFPKGC